MKSTQINGHIQPLNQCSRISVISRILMIIKKAFVGANMANLNSFQRSLKVKFLTCLLPHKQHINFSATFQNEMFSKSYLDAPLISSISENTESFENNSSCVAFASCFPKLFSFLVLERTQCSPGTFLSRQFACGYLILEVRNVWRHGYGLFHAT